MDHDDNEESTTDQILKLNLDLEESCFSICPNEQILCEILLDICYRDGFDTCIVWNLCGDVIVDKLAQKSRKFSYPVRNNYGDFWCCGSNFSMKDVIVGGENDD